MAFKSLAQKQKFKEMVASGQMDQSTYNAWLKDTGDTKLPERVAKPKKKSPHVAYAQRAKRISK